MRHPRQLLLNLLRLATGELASRLVGFAAFALLARRLEPSYYGAVEFAVALALFFAMVADFGLGMIGARAIAQGTQDTNRLAAQIPAARFLIVMLAIPVMGGTAILTGQNPKTVNLVWLFSFGLVAVPVFQRWLLQGRELMNLISIGQVMRSAGFLLGVAVFVNSSDDLFNVGIVEIVAALIGSFYYIAIQHFRITPFRVSFNFRAIGELIRESSAVGLSQMVWAANQYVPTILVATLIGGEALSWFGASQRIVLAAVSFSYVYHFNLFPSLSRNLVESKEAYDRLVSASFRSVSWIGVMISLTGMLFAKPLCVLVFGPPFGEAAMSFSILVWIIPVTMLSGHARHTLVAGMMQRYVLLAQLSGLAVILIVGFITIPTFGATAGAATMLGANIAVWITAHFYTVRKITPIPFWAVGRPLVVACAVYMVLQFLAPDNYIAAIIGVVLYSAIALLIDRNFLGDLRNVANMRGSVTKTHTK